MGDKLRFRFSKTGRIKYISHLDLMATMRRAFLRAGLRLKYSEGFNPHPYMSAAMPLSVGHESVCELMDVGIAEGLQPDGLPAIINAELPAGVEILEAYIPARKLSEIKWVEIMGLLYYDKGMPQDAAGSLSERFAEKSIVISKKTKSGSAELDIAPSIRDIKFYFSPDLRGGGEDAGDTEYDIIRLEAKISANNPTINPDNLISALEGEYGELAPAYAGFKRIEIYDREMKVFR